MVLIDSVQQSDPNSVTAGSFPARSDATRSNLSMHRVSCRASSNEENQLEGLLEFDVFQDCGKRWVCAIHRRLGRLPLQSAEFIPPGMTGTDSQARRILPACFVGIN